MGGLTGTGLLRERVWVSRPVDVDDGYGGTTRTWEVTGVEVPARKLGISAPQSARVADQMTNHEYAEFVLDNRYFNAITGNHLITTYDTRQWEVLSVEIQDRVTSAVCRDVITPENCASRA